MKFSLGISDFLEEISRLSNSIYFLYLLALIPEADFISPCYSWGLCLQMCSFPLPLSFRFTPVLSSLWALVTLSFCTSFPCRWSLSLLPVHHKPPSIGLQTLIYQIESPVSIYHFHCIIICFDFTCVKYINSLFHLRKSSPRYSSKKYRKFYMLFGKYMKYRCLMFAI